MRARLLSAFAAAALGGAPLVHAAVITGAVIGEGARPVGGATVHVVLDPAMPKCETTTAADGTFTLPCAATGVHVVRASYESLRSWDIDGIELGPDREIHLNFVLLPVSGTVAQSDTVPPEVAGFWTRPVPNPTLAVWGSTPVTLRMLAIIVAAVSFPLGAITMLAIGRRLGTQVRRLSAGEVGDLVLNPHRPLAGERVHTVATVGARGAEATVSYGADEMAVALAARRYGLVFTALVIGPALFAVFSLAFAVAMLIGQETWLLVAALLVPAVFVLTPIIIGIQALRRQRGPMDSVP